MCVVTSNAILHGNFSQSALNVHIDGNVITGPIDTVTDLTRLHLVCNALRDDEAVQAPPNAL